MWNTEESKRAMATNDKVRPLQLYEVSNCHNRIWTKTQFYVDTVRKAFPLSFLKGKRYYSTF